MQTLDIFLENIERAFRDLDRACMAHAQLHELKMVPDIVAEDYTAQFEMLAGRTGFNNTMLEDIYMQGLPNSILPKIFTQVTLPKGLEAWKMVVQNLVRLHQSLRPCSAETISDYNCDCPARLFQTVTLCHSMNELFKLPLRLPPAWCINARAHVPM